MFTQETYPYLEEVNEGILRHIPLAGKGDRQRVLDVGCGGGALGDAIARRGYEVWGIESVGSAADKAAGRIDRVVRADLTDLDVIGPALGGERFDHIVFSDVLEHLYDPLAVLRSYLGYLERPGRILISLPNVLNWHTRLAFLFGRFNYQNTGVLDRTHIRFFTFKTAVEMVNKAGLRIETIDFTPFVARAVLPIVKRVLNPGGDADDARSIIDSSAYRFYMRNLYPVEYAFGSLRKPLFAFRIIVVAGRNA